MKSDAGVGEEHGVGHRSVVEFRTTVILVFPQHVEHAGRGSLTRLSGGDRGGPVGDLTTAHKPSLVTAETDTGRCGRSARRGSRLGGDRYRGSEHRASGGNAERYHGVAKETHHRDPLGNRG